MTDTALPRMELDDLRDKGKLLSESNTFSGYWVYPENREREGQRILEIYFGKAWDENRDSELGGSTFWNSGRVQS